MAGKRKARGERKEPLFGLRAAGADLRLTAEDRIPGPESDGRAKKAAAKAVGKPATRAEAPAPWEKAAGDSTASGAEPGTWRLRLARIAYWCLVLCLWSMIGAVALVVWVGAHLPAIQSLEIPKRPPTIQIVGSDGSMLLQRGEQAGANVALNTLPPYLPKAFIAIEDRRFYSHHGVDPLGIARALFANLLRRGVSQGGSTLTQQLAKNLFLTQERTLTRKLQEVELALWLEHTHSKDEILELYLNRVYFGSGAYGVEAAAQRYFGKPARNVTLAEAAMLAGLVKSPSRLAPNRNPVGAEGRARLVLSAMADVKFITDAQAKAWIGHPAIKVKPEGAGTINYVADWIGEVLDDLVGQIDRDIVVETTIDPKLQSFAEATLIDTLAAKSVKFNVSQGALVAMTPDGAVRAMVGGRNYADSQFNRAVTAKRQPGSAFKPFVYLTALEAGLTPDTVRMDAPIELKGWKPENYSRDYLGPVTLTQALALSLNTVAVRLGLEVGPRNVAQTAHRLGITSRLEPNPSLALGTSEVSVVEMVSAYAPFANGGFAVTPHVVARIRTKDGRQLYAWKQERGNLVVDPRNVAMMNTMMRETLLSGTARKAEIPGWMAAGKTGTSQDFRDAWFVGYTANLVTGVWLGNDDNSPTRKATGGGLPVDIWSRVMRRAHEGVAVVNLPSVPTDPVSNFISSVTGPRPAPMPDPGPEGRLLPPGPPRPQAAAGLDGWLAQRLFGGPR